MNEQPAVYGSFVPTPPDPMRVPTIPVYKKSRWLEQEFQRLVADWKATRVTKSTVKRMAAHPAYQAIISMGWPAVPLILSELEREPDHWFIALHAITGASPVPKESQGKLDEMAKAWMAWWRRRGE